MSLPFNTVEIKPVVKDAVECIGRIPTPYLAVRNWNFSEELRRMGC
jgi:hypothetical protein